MAKVKDSPAIDTHEPMSRQHVKRIYGYYNMSPYWGTAFTWVGTAAGVLACQRPTTTMQGGGRTRFLLRGIETMIRICAA